MLFGLFGWDIWYGLLPSRHSQPLQPTCRRIAALSTYMNQQLELVVHLETPFASCDLPNSVVRETLLVGLTWPTEYWVTLAIAWLEQGAPLDIELVAALDEIAVTKSFSQGIRHRAFALARRWQCIQSAPSLSLKN